MKKPLEKISTENWTTSKKGAKYISTTVSNPVWEKIISTNLNLNDPGLILSNQVEKEAERLEKKNNNFDTNFVTLLEQRYELYRALNQALYKKGAKPYRLAEIQKTAAKFPELEESAADEIYSIETHLAEFERRKIMSSHTGLKEMGKVLKHYKDEAKGSNFSVLLRLQEIARKRTSGITNSYGKSSRFGKGRNLEVDEFYKNLAKLNIFGTSIEKEVNTFFGKQAEQVEKNPAQNKDIENVEHVEKIKGNKELDKESTESIQDGREPEPAGITIPTQKLFEENTSFVKFIKNFYKVEKDKVSKDFLFSGEDDYQFSVLDNFSEESFKILKGIFAENQLKLKEFSEEFTTKTNKLSKSNYKSMEFSSAEAKNIQLLLNKNNNKKLSEEINKKIDDQNERTNVRENVSLLEEKTLSFSAVDKNYDWSFPNDTFENYKDSHKAYVKVLSDHDLSVNSSQYKKIAAFRDPYLFTVVGALFGNADHKFKFDNAEYDLPMFQYAKRHIEILTKQGKDQDEVYAEYTIENPGLKLQHKGEGDKNFLEFPLQGKAIVRFKLTEAGAKLESVVVSNPVLSHIILSKTELVIHKDMVEAARLFETGDDSSIKAAQKLLENVIELQNDEEVVQTAQRELEEVQGRQNRRKCTTLFSGNGVLNSSSTFSRSHEPAKRKFTPQNPDETSVQGKDDGLTITSCS